MKNLISKLLLVIRTIENFPTAIMDRLGLLHGSVVYRIRNSDIQFMARTGTEDIAEIAVIASGSEYTLDLLDLPEKPVIIDLGGHIGTFSIPMAKMYANKASIYAFEPDKENYSLFKKNITLNKITSVKLFNMAIADYEGKGLLVKKDINHNDAYYLDFKKSDDFNCAVSTLKKALSAYSLKHIDLLKMDIEGGEYTILLDKISYAFIQQKVHYMMLEHHPIDAYYNYALVKKLLKKDFRILNNPTNVLILENKHMESKNT